MYMYASYFPLILPNLDKIAHWAILYRHCLQIRFRLDQPDTDDKIVKNSHNAIHSIASLSRYWYVDME